MKKKYIYIEEVYAEKNENKRRKETNDTGEVGMRGENYIEIYIYIKRVTYISNKYIYTCAETLNEHNSGDDEDRDDEL